jgi:hypothetical protein
MLKLQLDQSLADDALHWNHWFVGLCDGEASFTFHNIPKLRCAKPRFRLCMQGDEAIFHEIQKRFGTIGSVSGAYTPPSLRAGTQTAYSERSDWCVDGINCCLRLVEFFERFPLRSRKQADFVIWAQLVREASKPNYDKLKLNSIAWRLSEGKVSGNSRKAQATLRKWLSV